MTLTHRPISCGCILPRVCPGRTAVHHTQHYPPRPQCPLCDRDGGGDDGGVAMVAMVVMVVVVIVAMVVSGGGG